MFFSHFVFLAVAQTALATDLSSLSSLLQDISSEVYADLREIAVDVWNNPETSRQEFYAHERVVSYFEGNTGEPWTVTPSAYGEPTAWSLNYVNLPSTDGTKLPSIGFLSEYDALLDIGHACGHNLILLNGLAAGSMMRRAVVELGIPANITIFGTPDEEDTGGKRRLQNAGAFEGLDIVFMAHPTVSNAIQPMKARRDLFLTLHGHSHSQAVKEAWDAMVTIRDLKGLPLPGSQTTATPILNVGAYTLNVVQTTIDLGVTGSSMVDVAKAINTTKESNDAFAEVTYALTEDQGGVSIHFEGPGGHAALGTEGPLSLSLEAYRTLSTADPDLLFYLPGNTTVLDIGVTVSVRSRYSIDMSDVEDAVVASVTASSISWDIEYPALEVTPVLPGMLIDLMANEEQEQWVISEQAPASTDASFIQLPVVTEDTYVLKEAGQVVLHANFGICSEDRATCPFNHMPEFAEMAGEDYAYEQTEKIARVLAHLAVELADDADLMSKVREIVA